MPDVIARDWNDLSDLLQEGAWREDLRRLRSKFVFRGQASAAADLTTSLMRLGGDYAPLEGALLRTFRRYAVRWAPGTDDTVWNWLALAQHHGLPTRMLDWTYSPYVALHFATCDTDHWCEDGAVWCVDFAETNGLLPPVLRDALSGEGAAVFTAELLAEAAPTLADFDRLATDPFAVFFEPPSLDDRIVNQFALFGLLSSPTVSLDVWLAEREENAFRRVVVPAALKPEVRDRLDQANFTERVLFPGLDGLSEWLRRYYSPRA
jgi:hypothetical protein